MLTKMDLVKSALMSFLLLYEYVTCFRFVFITITPCLIIINIIIANEQGGSQIKQWAEKISNRSNI